MSLFFMSLLWGGGRGSRQISQMSFNILFFLEGFPNGFPNSNYSRVARIYYRVEGIVKESIINGKGMLKNLL